MDAILQSRRLLWNWEMLWWWATICSPSPGPKADEVDYLCNVVSENWLYSILLYSLPLEPAFTSKLVRSTSGNGTQMRLVPQVRFFLLFFTILMFIYCMHVLILLSDIRTTTDASGYYIIMARTGRMTRTARKFELRNFDASIFRWQ